MSTEQLKVAQVGDWVYFEGEKRPYTIRARDCEFVICTKPFAARKTYLYTIVDFVRDVRGADNMIFGLSYETDEDCEERLENMNDSNSEMEVSHRNYVRLSVTKVVSMTKEKVPE